VTVVCSDDAGFGRASVTSPVSAALLGFAVGDTIHWETPAGTRRITVVAVH